MRNDPQSQCDAARKSRPWADTGTTEEDAATIGRLDVHSRPAAGDARQAAADHPAPDGPELRAASGAAGGPVARRDPREIDLAMRVANALRSDCDVPDDLITARVRDGWVTLEGTVERAAQRDAAERAVRQVTGIRGLTNRVVDSRISTDEVTHRVQRAFQEAAERDASTIHAEAHDGTVTLRGIVQTSAEREVADRAAVSVPGVKAVDDRISVGRRPPPASG